MLEINSFITSIFFNKLFRVERAAVLAVHVHLVGLIEQNNLSCKSGPGNTLILCKIIKYIMKSL